MQLDSETRSDFQKAGEAIQLCSEKLARSVADDSWPLATDISVSLTEKVERLRTTVADVLSKPEHTEIDTGQLNDAVVSLRKFVPELKAANLTAAVAYMAAKANRDADED